MTNPNDSAHGYGFCTADGQNVQNVEGLTKREYFAAMAMQGLLVNYKANDQYGNSPYYPMVVDIAVRQADALINALNQDNETTTI